MSRYLYGYKNFTPNAKGATHYLIENTTAGISRYMSVASQGGRNILTFSETNYRVNNGSIALAYLGNVLTNWQNITYFIERDVETGFFMCYFVESAVIASGNVYFNVRVDYWASYLLKANISDIHVTRCNRKLKNGYYDDVKETFTPFRSTSVFNFCENNYVINPDQDGTILTSGDLEAIGVHPYGENYELQTLTAEDLSIIVDATFNLEENASGSRTISKTQLFNIDIADLLDDFANVGMFANMHFLEVIRGAIGCITKVTSTGSFFRNNEIKINHLYILPNFFLSADEYRTSNYIEGISRIGDESDHIIKLYFMGDVHEVRQLPILSLPKNHKWAFGCVGNLLDITRPVDYDGEAIKIAFDFAPCEARATITQRSNYKEITSSFELPLTLASNTTDAIDGVVKTIKNTAVTMGALLSIYAGAQSGNFGLIAGGVGGIAGAVSRQLGKSNPMTTEQTGSAFTSYNWLLVDDDQVIAPFVYVGVASTINEEEHARKDGVNYDEYIETLNLDDRDLLGEGTDADTFIMCDATIENIPLTARDDIAKQLKEGVSYVTA